MALRQEDLLGSGDARIYAFPAAAAAAGRRRAAMYRRRRRTCAAVVVVCAAVLLAVGGAPATGSADRIRPRSVLVQDGDTLWGIAADAAPPGADIRSYVRALAELNDTGPGVVPGTRLVLPR